MKQSLQQLVKQTLDDMKAEDIIELDVHELTTITDMMFICTGRSNRHVKSTVSKLAETAKIAGYSTFGIEGEESADWVLLDLGEIVIHVMLANTRAFYQLEDLWSQSSIHNNI